MNRKQWHTMHSWDWFRLEQWRYTFREDKGIRWGGSPAAFKRILGKTEGKLALDASCGLGLKTIVMHEMGIDVMGSDKCEIAVEKARELAKMEGQQIEFFTSRWSELPANTRVQFDAVFNDALTWTITRERFKAAIRGFYNVLKPKGVLVFMGAPEGATETETLELLEEDWEANPRFNIEWTYSDGTTRCTCLVARERSDDYIDNHHLYLIEEGDEQRIETATLRRPFYWHTGLLKELFLEAGYSRFDTRHFRGMGKGGTDFSLNVAVK